MKFKADPFSAKLQAAMTRLASTRQSPVVIDGMYHTWNGSHYELLDPDGFNEYVIKFAETVFEAPDAIPVARIKDALKLFELKKTLFIRKRVKSQTVLVNFQNGTLEICPKTGTHLFREHRQEDLLTYALDYGYNEHASEPTEFLNFLNDVLPDPATQQRFLECAALPFIPKHVANMERAVYLFGPGGTGKSTMLNFLEVLYGRPNCSHVAISTATASGDPRHFAMVGKLANFDTDSNSIRDFSVFKKLVSKEPVEFRRLFSEPVTSESIPVMFFAGNTYTQVEHSEAFMARLELFEFTRVFRGTDAQRFDLAQALESCRSGVFNLILTALKRLIRNRFRLTHSEETLQAKQTMRDSTDGVTEFLEMVGAKFSKSTGNLISVSALRELYVNWCRTYGYKPLRREFDKRVELKGFLKIKDRSSGGKYYWSMEISL